MLVARATLVNVVHTSAGGCRTAHQDGLLQKCMLCGELQLGKRCPNADPWSQWARLGTPGAWSLLFADVEVLDPAIPCVGAPGLFELPAVPASGCQRS
jgi:hypothetical protein